MHKVFYTKCQVLFNLRNLLNIKILSRNIAITLHVIKKSYLLKTVDKANIGWYYNTGNVSEKEIFLRFLAKIDGKIHLNDVSSVDVWNLAK